MGVEVSRSVTKERIEVQVFNNQNDRGSVDQAVVEASDYGRGLYQSEGFE